MSTEPVSPSAADNGRVKRVFKTYDHPEAAGRSPQKGEAEYPLTFGLDDGSQLIVRMGESGFQNVTNLLMMMLANVPSSDDGSLTGISYTELKAENASLTAALAANQKQLKEITQVAGERLGWHTESRRRAEKAEAQLASQQEALVTAMLALEDAKIELTFSHTEDHQKRSALLIPKINSALAQVNACLPVETK